MTIISQDYAFLSNDVYSRAAASDQELTVPSGTKYLAIEVHGNLVELLWDAYPAAVEELSASFRKI